MCFKVLWRLCNRGDGWGAFILCLIASWVQDQLADEQAINFFCREFAGNSAAFSLARVSRYERFLTISFCSAQYAEVLSGRNFTVPLRRSGGGSITFE